MYAITYHGLKHINMATPPSPVQLYVVTRDTDGLL